MARLPGHIRPKEPISDWERMVVPVWTNQGFRYRHVAAIVYGIHVDRVTDGEVLRVGSIARDAEAGNSKYVTLQNREADMRLDTTLRRLAVERKSPPRVVNVRMRLKSRHGHRAKGRRR